MVNNISKLNRSILITGCSSGIGYDAAHVLHKRGWRVFATCRNENDCQRLRQQGLETMRLDYDDTASIKMALDEVLERTGGRLDALYNNGAYMTPGLVQDCSRAALEDIFSANFFGYFDLIKQVIPIMLKQGYGRIINCSSVLGLVALPGRGPYTATKFAMEGLTDTLRLELRGKSIKVILIEPGPISTDIHIKARANFEKWIDWKNSLAREFYQKRLMPHLYRDEGQRNPGQLPARSVTKKLILALESKNPRPRYYVTYVTYLMAFLRRILSTRANDWFTSRI